MKYVEANAIIEDMIKDKGNKFIYYPVSAMPYIDVTVKDMMLTSPEYGEIKIDENRLSGLFVRFNKVPKDITLHGRINSQLNWDKYEFNHNLKLVFNPNKRLDYYTVMASNVTPHYVSGGVFDDLPIEAQPSYIHSLNLNLNNRNNVFGNTTNVLKSVEQMNKDAHDQIYRNWLGAQAIRDKSGVVVVREIPDNYIYDRIASVETEKIGKYGDYDLYKCTLANGVSVALSCNMIGWTEIEDAIGCNIGFNYFDIKDGLATHIFNIDFTGAGKRTTIPDAAISYTPIININYI